MSQFWRRGSQLSIPAVQYPKRPPSREQRFVWIVVSKAGAASPRCSAPAMGALQKKLLTSRGRRSKLRSRQAWPASLGVQARLGQAHPDRLPTCQADRRPGTVPLAGRRCGRLPKLWPLYCYFKVHFYSDFLCSLPHGLSLHEAPILFLYSIQ